MPKQKTHKGTAKRVKVTGTGKLMHEQANNQHKFEYKSSSRKRRLDQEQLLSPADTKRLKKLLGR
jgi:large subunit ribosomal protein L35